jgi:hypothetical protein
MNPAESASLIENEMARADSAASLVPTGMNPVENSQGQRATVLARIARVIFPRWRCGLLFQWAGNLI